MRLFIPLMVICAAMPTGCSATRLRYQTTQQARTLSDVEEQQVLDNIAMFVVNAGSTPFFALPTGGGTTTSQQATGTATLLWSPRAITSEAGALSGQLGSQSNWSLKPINDPERIDLMKCVFLHVTQTCPVDGSCQAKLQRYFGNDLATTIPSAWYSACNKRPKHSNCCVKVGHYCGTYVTVTPEYFEYLSRVTVAILDIATVDSTVLANKLANKNKTIQIDETFTVGEGDHKRTIKGTRSVSVSEYKKLRTGETGISKFNAVAEDSLSKDDEPVDSLRARRETGPAFDSLIQLNGLAPR